MNQFTQAQSTAIHSLDPILFVSAGAGTGKTRVLVERFIHLVSTRQARASEIAALTFTKVAAEEMKERIRARCMAEAAKASELDDKRFWREQYIELESARIGTIHAFCSGLLRAHPVEAEVDPRFGLLEEAQALVLRGRVADETIEAELQGGDSIVQTAMRVGTRTLREFLIAGLGKRYQLTESSARYDRPEKEVVSGWAEATRALIVREHASLLQSKPFGQHHAALQQDGCDDANDKAEQLRLALLEPLEAFVRAQTVEAIRLASEQIAIRLYRVGKLGSRKVWDATALEGVQQAFRAIRVLLGRLKTVLGYLDLEHGTEAYQVGVDLARLARRAVAAYDRLKSERAVLDFEDLLLKTGALVAEEPVVAAEFARGTRQVMVDEYQDTDPIQRDIVYGLTRIGNPKGPAVFFVGDGKQSIYRFRGADVSVFLETERRVAEKHDTIQLDTNFRSHPKLIDFLNSFFESLMAPEQGSTHQDYESPYTALLPGLSDEGGEGTAGVEITVLDDPDGSLGADRMRCHEAVWIAQRIKALAKETPYRQIALLMRRTGSSHLYEEALDNAAIPYRVESGRGFYRRQEVVDITNGLKVINNRLDDLSLVGLLRSPMVALSDEALYWLCHERGESTVWSRMDDPAVHAQLSKEERDRLRVASRWLHRLSEARARLSITGLIRQLIDTTQYEAVLGTRWRGEQMVLNVRKMIDLARGFDTGGRFTLSDYLVYVTEYMDRDAYEPQASAADEEQNAVSIMTVHGAKGREFPVLFLADCSSSTRGGGDPIECDPEFGFGRKLVIDGDEIQTQANRLIAFERANRETAESKRLLYVALTRAQERIILSGCTKKGKATKSSWLSWIFDRYAVETGAALQEAKPAGCSIHLPAWAEWAETVYSAAPTGSAKARAALVAGTRLPEPKGATLDTASVLTAIEPVPIRSSPDRSISPTELLDYHTCPRYYYYNTMLGLREPVDRVEHDPHPISGSALGTLVHAVLEQWDFLDRDEADRLVQKWIAVDSRLAVSHAPYRDEAMALLDRFQTMPTCSTLLEAKQVRKEVPFLLNVAGHRVEGIIDLLVEKSDGTFLVVDYKTDRVAVEQVPERAKHHAFQLGLYQMAVSQILGVEPVAGALAFLRPGVEQAMTPYTQESDLIGGPVRAALAGIESAEFPKIPGSRGFCGFSSSCSTPSCA